MAALHTIFQCQFHFFMLLEKESGMVHFIVDLPYLILTLFKMDNGCKWIIQSTLAILNECLSWKYF